MKHSQFAAAATGLIAAALLLAGCAAPSPTGKPTESTSAGPVAGPTPTPTVVADPSQVRVPFDCDALYSAATAKPLVGTTLTASGGKDAQLQHIQDVAQRQAGALSCEWSGGIGTDVGPSNFLAISIAPDAADQYDANLAANQPAKDHPVANTAGDKSSYYCHNGGALFEGYTCFGEVTVGSYWASVGITHTVPVTPKGVAAAMQKALDKTVDTLTAAPAITLPAWPVPAGPATTFCSDPNSTTKVRSALGDQSLTAPRPSAPTINAATIGKSEGKYASCYWQSKKTGILDVTVLNGGAWAFPTFKPVLPIDSTMHGTKFVASTIPGASTALVACEQGQCEAFLAIGKAAVQIDFETASTAQTMAGIAKLVGVIAAS